MVKCHSLVVEHNTGYKCETLCGVIRNHLSSISSNDHDIKHIDLTQ